jgi:hypothetical protein
VLADELACELVEVAAADCVLAAVVLVEAELACEAEL